MMAFRCTGPSFPQFAMAGADPARQRDDGPRSPSCRLATLSGAEHVQPFQRLGRALDPDAAAVHRRPLVFRRLGTVIGLGHDGRVRAIRGQLVGPPVPPARLGRATGRGVAAIRRNTATGSYPLPVIGTPPPVRSSPHGTRWV